MQTSVPAIPALEGLSTNVWIKFDLLETFPDASLGPNPFAKSKQACGPISTGLLL